MIRRSALMGAGAFLSAGLLALLDPQRGRRRRALVLDKANRASRLIGDAAGTTWRDLSHSATGVAADARRILGGPQAPDEILHERIRSRIGRMVSHPSSIEVAVRDGDVVLVGRVLEHELDGLLRGVRETPGVSGVEDRLEVEQAGWVPDVQGIGAPRERRLELLQENWSPTTRLLTGLAGAGLGIWGARRRGVLGALLAALGSGVMARAATNRPLAVRRFERARRGNDMPAEQDRTEAHADVAAPEAPLVTEDAAAPPPRRRPASTRRSVQDPARPGEETSQTGMVLKPE